jgi:F-type H+-transporting ATPase subunit b
MAQAMTALGIEWQQVITNIIGFAIFLWLMRKYAWNPILDFMDQRREEIAGNFRKIEEEKADLEKLKGKYQGYIDKIDEEATQRIQAAIKNGQDAARQIEDEARNKAQTIVQRARVDTDRILEDARLQFKDFVIDVGVEAGKKAAMDTLDETTHRKLVEKFVEELTNVH